MSTVSTVNTITTDVQQFIPAVSAGVQAAEIAAQTAASQGIIVTGAQKASAVLEGIQAGSGVLAQGTGQVAAISGLINLFVSIFNSLNLFKHSTAPATGGAA